MRLNHLHFRTARLAETRAFYESYFGFRLHVELGPTLVLANPDHFYLAMDPGSPKDAIESTESLHFGFCLESPAQVREVYDRMKVAGVSFLQMLTELSPNATQFYCLDPTGNRVEVGWYRPLPAHPASPARQAHG